MYFPRFFCSDLPPLLVLFPESCLEDGKRGVETWVCLFLLGSKALTARKKGRAFPFPPVTVLSSALQLSLYPHLSREGLTSAERGGGGRGGRPTVGKVPEKRRKGEKESNRWHDINHGDNGCIMSITRREEEEEDGNAAASADRRRGWGKRCGISFFWWRDRYLEDHT